MSSQEDITGLLHQWRAGDEQARAQLFDAVYDQIHRLARVVLSSDQQRAVVQPTELANECALRLLKIQELNWQDRSHFLAMVVTTMRRVLIDQARKKQAGKRRGADVTLHTGHIGNKSEQTGIDILALDEALTRLAVLSEERARVVELKFFGGLSNEEIAEVMAVSESTVKRTWRSARAWLYVQLEDSAQQ